MQSRNKKCPDVVEPGNNRGERSKTKLSSQGAKILKLLVVQVKAGWGNSPVRVGFYFDLVNQNAVVNEGVIVVLIVLRPHGRTEQYKQGQVQIMSRVVIKKASSINNKHIAMAT